MTRVLLIQLPIPQLNFGRRTGNIPLAAACLKQAAADMESVRVDILSESTAAYLGDAALLERIVEFEPDVVGFTVYGWNLARSHYLARRLKKTASPRIVFGGPEITPDSTPAQCGHVDFHVRGEGEVSFRRLLAEPSLWRTRSAEYNANAVFRTAPSPYVGGYPDPKIENMMLLETQRGCPYRCGYCFYSKARPGVSRKKLPLILQGIRWAMDQGLSELFLLDPSLNARPDLKTLLKEMARLNPQRALNGLSEIRAEAIDEPLADLFAAAGFTWFEIGLQSTNPTALKIMNRPTDMARFLEGVRCLTRRDITPAIDLIAGLPGDDLKGFKRSVDFVADHRLQTDIQVFPLSVLPGTEYRLKSRQLGLRYEPQPPYPVLETATFSSEDLLEAFDYAESRFDVCLYPMPDLNIAWRHSGRSRPERLPDNWVMLEDGLYVNQLILRKRRDPTEIKRLAGRLTHPYQVHFGPDIGDRDYLATVLKLVSERNPFTPFEVVFMEPSSLPNTADLLTHIQLRRPHYLDLDQRYLFPRPGNRAVVFTVVTVRRQSAFNGEMQRQVYWWQHRRLPAVDDLTALSELDGMLIDSPLGPDALQAWQNRFSGDAGEFLHIGFADRALQRRWFELTAGDAYYLRVLEG
jgi:radical SAM superfamily enzyme YgiQ (UPF0313 family)